MLSPSVRQEGKTCPWNPWLTKVVGATDLFFLSVRTHVGSLRGLRRQGAPPESKPWTSWGLSLKEGLGSWVNEGPLFPGVSSRGPTSITFPPEEPRGSWTTFSYSFLWTEPPKRTGLHVSNSLRPYFSTLQGPLLVLSEGLKRLLLCPVSRLSKRGGYWDVT